MITVDDAALFASFAHYNQEDKAGQPYMDHVLAVWKKVKDAGAPEYVQIAALLHDVVEDTSITLEHLRGAGYDERTIEIVELLTKKKGQSNDEYYSRIRGNEFAVLVKLADVYSNSDEDRLAALPSETQIRLREKYRKAILALTQED